MNFNFNADRIKKNVAVIHLVAYGWLVACEQKQSPEREEDTKEFTQNYVPKEIELEEDDRIWNVNRSKKNKEQNSADKKNRKQPKEEKKAVKEVPVLAEKETEKDNQKVSEGQQDKLLPENRIYTSRKQLVKRKLSDYDEVRAYYHKRAVVKLNEKYGYIDEKGYELIAPRYDFAEDFSENYGMARVRIWDKVGFVDKNGDEVIPLEYRYIDKFVNGLAYARLIDGEEFFINMQGIAVCDKVDEYYDGVARIKKGNKIGYIDQKGKVIVPVIYEYGTHFEKGQAEVKLGEKHFIIDKSGKCLRNCDE